jgi:hypothetical protein
MHMNTRNFYQMHNYMRPAWSDAEKQFIARFLYPIPGIKRDKIGNLFVLVGDAPTVLWSSHTDTVHQRSGRQTVIEEEGCLVVENPQISNCLGADCTTGVWLMTEMIEAKVPGLYVFHRGEEQGCIGSKYIRNNTPEVLDGIRFAIAFDRRGYDSVVTKQVGGRCASDAFAHSLINAIGGEVSLPLKPDPTGIYTDTAQYTKLVDECTNLSVGYFHQHTSREYQDVDHLWNLREQLCSIDTSTLVAERDKSKQEYSYPYGGGYQRSYSYPRGRKAVVAFDDYAPVKAVRTVEDIVRRYPLGVTALLEHYGYDAVSLVDALDQLDY